ncbi:nucleotidyltransferase domain-containing protein [Delftia sp. PS-11]|uniref:nucleotidyltransferase domain-containing protein n=1 Tax=Delftia sp. PS-11 TaxID=2767222 RepID=UPI0024556DB3|nr:nucleotidyltransferase domain-containing protein [Delftia sp. PS-11]KAJ8743118.1 nucleotidyltransferase domain-containing protein [Delftia sp. PS-11]
MEQEKVLSAHPVSDAMQATVRAELAGLERHHGVTVLFACESGSRGWGFASPDSDYDVRFIYVHRLPWYLTVSPGRDVIEQPISGELDVSGWELRKTLGLLRASNPTVLEWLRSPIVYRQAQPWAERLHALAVQGFSPVRGYHHYVSMARKNLRAHLSGDVVRYKKYFYVLRPLLAARWIREGRGAPPMRFAQLAACTLADDAGLLAEINELLELKMRLGEAAKGPRRARICSFLERELACAMAHQPGPSDSCDAAPLDGYLREAVAHFHEE